MLNTDLTPVPSAGATGQAGQTKEDVLQRSQGAYMNRSGLVNKLKDKAALSKKDAAEVVDTFFDEITEALVKGERVEIRSFGSFTVKNYKPYVGRNPKTGEQINVSSKKLPFFKVGKELKEKVDSQ
ncbi:MAG: HU family DNA-binding protein [Thermodesulfobacteriota bacterium]|nr:HU family DNA-binding protein [Thermodesulfobacteriota bacterium]